MKSTKKKKKGKIKPTIEWHALSFSLLIVFWATAPQIAFSSDSSVAIANTLLCVYFFYLFVENYLKISDLGKSLKKKWKAWPTRRHKIISGACILGLGCIGLIKFIPTLKVPYEECKVK